MKLVLLCMLLFAPAALADPVEVTAKIVELPKPPHCGYLMIKAVVRYEVISVDKGIYKPKEVLAIETCPEMLSVGAQRRFTLLRPAKPGSYIDQFVSKPGTRWEVTPR